MNLSHLAVNSLSFSLIAFVGAQATHQPGDFPTPPWPPHSHIEVAPIVSSTVMETIAGDVVQGPTTTASRTPSHSLPPAVSQWWEAATAVQYLMRRPQMAAIIDADPERLNVSGNGVFVMPAVVVDAPARTNESAEVGPAANENHEKHKHPEHPERDRKAPLRGQVIVTVSAQGSLAPSTSVPLTGIEVASS